MITLREVEAYLDWLRRVRRASEGTLATYGPTLRALVKARVDSSGVEGLEGFVQRPRRGGAPASPATMAREVTTLRSFYGWCLKRDLVACDPTVDLVVPAVHNVNPKPVSDETWLDFWLSDLTDRERLFVGLPFFAGLRRAELSALRPSHVQLDPLALVGFTRKGGGDDVLHLADVLEVFQVRMPHLGAHLFEGALRAGVGRAHPDGTLLRRRANEAYRSMGVPWTPHQGRHSFVTNLLRAGLPLHMVSRLANHASVNTTMRYTRVSGTDVRDWLASAS